MKKCILFLCLLWSLASNSQQTDWQLLDLQKDGVFGISAEKAYNELLTGKKPNMVIVAIIDTGIDTTHIDLKGIIWKNPGEIPGNGIDDDKNGFVDDVNGWNFTGSELGKEDLVNLIRPNKKFYDSLSNSRVPEIYLAGYREYRKILKEFPPHLASPNAYIDELTTAKETVDKIIDKIRKKNPFPEDLRKYKPEDAYEKTLMERVLERLPAYKNFQAYYDSEITGMIDKLQYHLAHGLNFADTAANSLQYAYENGDITNDIVGPVEPRLTAYHGTHIAGIIAANRENNTGIKGIADHVKIMPLKVLTVVRELRDKNLANAIIYAVNNGAKIINLSFGKPYTWDKKAVDEAIRFAMSKDVLVIHAVGNEGKDLDNIQQFPNRDYLDGKGKADAWINVGASGPVNDSTLIPLFSNYGKKTVDVFAPGYQIYSCIPGSGYMKFDGTSMAAPVVTGIAALIREYYPELSALQVRDIILASVVKVNHNVIVWNDNRLPVSASFSEFCTSGGIVNAYNALKLAATYK